MNHEELIIGKRASKRAKQSQLIVTAVAIYPNHAELVVGRPGLLNINGDIRLGEALILETPEGLFEVRVMEMTAVLVKVLVTDLVGRPGLIGGFIDQDISNSYFTAEERERITLSIQEIREKISTDASIASEKLDFISRKLSYIESASERLGRKDWINLTLGTLTSIVVSIGLDPSSARALFSVAEKTLFWVFNSGIKILGG
jgi:hypothetical protein